MRIELMKPSLSDRGFGRGDRWIVVDGVRWGRTHVQSRGPQGSVTKFAPVDGSMISAKEGKEALTDFRGYHDVKVYSDRIHQRSHRFDTDKTVTLEQRVIEQIKVLIDQGKLLHPDKIREQEEQAMMDYRERQDEERHNRIMAFRAKAREALQINDPESDDPRIESVVAVMHWAQEQ